MGEMRRDTVRPGEAGWMHLLDDLEECSVKLGENLVAVFQLEADVVGLHPGYVLERGAGRGSAAILTSSWT